MKNNMRVTFYGGVGTVTGANFLLEGKTAKILIDCGLIQGRQYGEDKNRKDFVYNPAEMDYLFVTHAHIDHIGRIPKLVANGFKGQIFSTPSTKEIAKFMFEDAVRVLQYEAKKTNREPLYGSGDVEKALDLWKSISYHEIKDIGDFKVIPKDAGHILGSAMYEFENKETGKKIVFTGDLGNSPTPLLKDTEKIKDVDYLVMESVYGDRNHENKTERKEKLKQVLNKVIKRNGTLIIPVFSLEKTQVLLYEMNDLIEGGSVPEVPVFLDSPLAIKLTDIYSDQLNNYNENVQKEIKGGDDIFDFPKLKKTLHQKESEIIDRTAGPKVIISASGMSVGGRVTSHEKRYLPDPNNALLFIGYQVAGSLGRRMKDGAGEVNIDGTDVPIRAEIITIDGYSSHKDSDGLLEFVYGSAETLKNVFVVMGEPKSALFLVQKIRDNLGIEATHPKEGESFELK